MECRAGSKTAESYSTLLGSPASIVCCGAMRSLPIHTAGIAWPWPVTETFGLEIWVVVRLSLPDAPPGRNSVTAPATSTASPTLCASADLV